MEKWPELLCLLLLLLLLPNHQHAASRKDMLSPKFPPKHPYLMITPDEIARVHARVDTAGWARKALVRIVRNADRVLKKPPEIPEGIHSDHRRVARSPRRPRPSTPERRSGRRIGRIAVHKNAALQNNC